MCCSTSRHWRSDGVACIGAATALMAATIGMVQHDIKRVLAYSTVSQLGYMFMACGVGAYEAGIFHLMTHAFFKALLFLAAGSVIHALSGEQDMRLMGGLRKKIPVTFWTMTMGVFAIAGLPPLAAFFSKDEILYQTYIWNNPLHLVLWAVGMLTAGLTSFYMFRLWFKTFFGAPRFDEAHVGAHPAEAGHDSGQTHHAHGVHESPAVMTIPLAILAVLSIIGGWVGVPLAFGGHNEFEHFLGPVFNPAEHVAEHVAARGPEVGLALCSVIVALLGLALAWQWYYRKPGTAAALAQKAKPLYSLLDHKYWVDEIYSKWILVPLLWFSRLFLGGLVEEGVVQGSASASSAGYDARLGEQAHCAHAVGQYPFLRWLAGLWRRRRDRCRSLYESSGGPMNFDHSILTLILLTPLAGAAILALLPEREGSKLHAAVALAITLLTLLFTLHLPAHFNYAAAGFQFQQDTPWITSPAIRYHLGVDGLSMWLLVLAGFLAPIGVLASWKTIASRTKLFYTLFLLQQVAMLGIFMALDLFLYYGFWELSLVPMTLLIATFGRTEGRRRAAIKFFLYAFIPSAILLVAMVWLYTTTGTFDFVKLQSLAAAHHLSANNHALWLCSLAFLVAFAVKVPIFPLHGWLSDAVQEAPTAAVMVLAGKLGLYSILRFSFGIFPEQSHYVAPVLIALGAIGIAYGSLLALVQVDLKKLAAFATLSHVSFIVLGIFTFTTVGLDGGVYQILNESLIGAALFVLLGLLYERYGTYNMRDYGGLATKHPWMVMMFVITTLAAVGLPMLSGFVGEFLILTGAMQAALAHHVLWTVLGTTGVIFGAAYMLWMIQRIFYGKLGLRSEEVAGWDLTVREHVELWPLAALFLLMGVISPYWMRAIDTYSTSVVASPTTFESSPIKHVETETYVVTPTQEVR